MSQAEMADIVIAGLKALGADGLYHHVGMGLARCVAEARQERLL